MGIRKHQRRPKRCGLRGIYYIKTKWFLKRLKKAKKNLAVIVSLKLLSVSEKGRFFMHNVKKWGIGMSCFYGVS